MQNKTNTPRGLRLQIGIFGRRNVGKSSLFNGLLHQNVAIVSEIAGTTTDPVEKAMEFPELGPVLFVDTAGIDDEGALGASRVARTQQVLERVDLALVVTDGVWNNFERQLLKLFRERATPVGIICSKNDLRTDRLLESQIRQEAMDTPVVSISTLTEDGLNEVRSMIIELAASKKDKRQQPLVADLIPEKGVAALVVPLDKAAPKGRLIQPQVLTIRELLDRGAYTLVVRDVELADALDKLAKPPDLVITDSQAFAKVAAVVPDNVPMTSFSILLARQKGDLAELVRGALAIGNLKAGDPILIAETCTHHPVEDDIGRIKIPALLEKKVGGKLAITHVAGCDKPHNFEDFKLVVQCGSCMWTRQEMLSRMATVKAASVPMTNYGVTIAYCLGILERAIRLFPAAHQVLISRK